jgi:cobalamin biosynthesis Mg chelatase CobN
MSKVIPSLPENFPKIKAANPMGLKANEEHDRFLEKNNPWALRDMAGRLLEAAKRQLWKNPSPDLLEQIYTIGYGVEAELEMRL